MIPGYKEIYEELGQTYEEKYAIGRTNIAKFTPNYEITEELVEDITKIFLFANAQGLNGFVAGSLEFEVQDDLKSSAANKIVTVTCCIAKNRG